MLSCSIGGIAGGVTTPLDVAKTRTMLAEKLDVPNHDSVDLRTFSMLRTIYTEKGVAGYVSKLSSEEHPETSWPKSRFCRSSHIPHVKKNIL